MRNGIKVWDLETTKSQQISNLVVSTNPKGDKLNSQNAFPSQKLFNLWKGYQFCVEELFQKKSQSAGKSRRPFEQS